MHPTLRLVAAGLAVLVMAAPAVSASRPPWDPAHPYDPCPETCPDSGGGLLGLDLDANVQADVEADVGALLELDADANVTADVDAQVDAVVDADVELEVDADVDVDVGSGGTGCPQTCPPAPQPVPDTDVEVGIVAKICIWIRGLLG